MIEFIKDYHVLISGIMGGFVSIIIMKWVLINEPESSTSGKVYYGKRPKILSLIMLAIGAFIVYGAFRSSPDQRLMAFFVAAPLGISSIWFVLETFTVSIKLNETSFKHKSIWRGTRDIPWSAIVKCDYSATIGCFVIETDGYGKVRISSMMNGVDLVIKRIA